MRFALFAIVWLVPAIICLLKGKVRMGLVGIATPLVASALSIAVVAVFWISNDSPTDSGWEDLGVVIVGLLIGFAIWIGVVAGALITTLVGAIRLAKPGSWWADRYDDEQLEAARIRFEELQPTPGPVD